MSAWVEEEILDNLRKKSEHSEGRKEGRKRGHGVILTEQLGDGTQFVGFSTQTDVRSKLLRINS